MIPAPMPLFSLVLALLVLQSWFQNQIPWRSSVGTRIGLGRDGTEPYTKGAEGIPTFSFLPNVQPGAQKELLWNWGCPSLQSVLCG